jgi:hypothetical protein
MFRSVASSRWSKGHLKKIRVNIVGDNQMSEDFDRVWDAIEGNRIAEEKAEHDKKTTLFRGDARAYREFFVGFNRFGVLETWCVSEYVNAAGYILLWRRCLDDYNFKDDRYVASKTREPLIRMARRRVINTRLKRYGDVDNVIPTIQWRDIDPSLPWKEQEERGNKWTKDELTDEERVLVERLAEKYERLPILERPAHEH